MRKLVSLLCGLAAVLAIGVFAEEAVLPEAPGAALAGGYKVWASARSGSGDGAVFCRVAVAINSANDGKSWSALEKDPAARCCELELRENCETAVIWQDGPEGRSFKAYDNLPFDAYKITAASPKSAKLGGAEMRSLLSLRAEKPKAGEAGDVVINGRFLNIERQYRELLLPPALEFRIALPFTDGKDAVLIINRQAQAYALAKITPEGIVARAAFHCGPEKEAPDLSDGAKLPEGPDFYAFETGPIAKDSEVTVIMSESSAEHPDAPKTVSHANFPIKLFDHLAHNPNIRDLRHNMRAVCAVKAESLEDGQVKISMRFIKFGGDDKALTPFTMGIDKTVQPGRSCLIGKTE